MRRERSIADVLASEQRYAEAAADIVRRHSPIEFSATHQAYVCAWCSTQHGQPCNWPCRDRAAVGHLIDDPSNALLPFDEHGRDIPRTGLPSG